MTNNATVTNKTNLLVSIDTQKNPKKNKIKIIIIINTTKTPNPLNQIKSVKKHYKTKLPTNKLRPRPNGLANKKSGKKEEEEEEEKTQKKSKKSPNTYKIIITKQIPKNNKRNTTLKTPHTNNKITTSNKPIDSHKIPLSYKIKPIQPHITPKWTHNKIKNLNKYINNQTQQTKQITKKIHNIKTTHINKIQTKHQKTKIKPSHPHKHKTKTKSTPKPPNRLNKTRTTDKTPQNTHITKNIKTKKHSSKIKTITSHHTINIYLRKNNNNNNSNKNKTYHKEKNNTLTQYNQARPTGLAKKEIKEYNKNRNIKKKRKTQTLQAFITLHKPHKHTKRIYIHNIHTHQQNNNNYKTT